LVFISSFVYSQNETNNWFFGFNAGLSFNTNPPTVLNASNMQTTYSSASMSDGNGNLLFYTDGMDVWDKTHSLMANGSGLNLTSNGPQNCIILKQPGNPNLYYIFYLRWTICPSCSNTLFYSVVDMSLAAGQGSVTTKNTVLYSTPTGVLGVGSKVTATRHCNGNDIWILTRESIWTNGTATGVYNPNFRAFLLTSAGIGNTAITSPASSYTVWDNTNYDYWGNLKISPNGKKVGVANYSSHNNSMFEVYDFDNSTGVVSNSLALFNNVTNNGPWYGGMACEFSPDGTKFYGVHHGTLITQGTMLYQWDLCAGSSQAVVASKYTVASNIPFWSNNLQVARDGKIYYPVFQQSNLCVIDNPNALGASCNYLPQAQNTFPNNSWFGLPNFMTSYFVQRPPPTPFTHTVSNTYGCQSAQFNSNYTPSITTIGCVSSGYTLTGLQWDFGDPASGANNTSSLDSPIHHFTSLGTYTVNLILNYTCGGGTDTLKQVVNINQPCISVTSTSVTCASLGSATVAAISGIGPFSYTWMPIAQTGSVATGLSPGNYTLTVLDAGNNSTYTITTFVGTSNSFTGTVNHANKVKCNGANTATANVSNILGGSGSQTYFWTNTVSAISYTNPTPLLGEGNWSLTVTDALSGCQFKEVFYISQPPPLNLVLSSSSSTACAGTSVTLNGINSGGTPYLLGSGYTYTWIAGPVNSVQVVSQTVAGTPVYTLSSRYSLNCFITKTISIGFIPKPVLSVTNASICPLETGTLTVSGASSYTWASTTLNLTGNTWTDSPMISTQYSVFGSANSCTSMATSSIVLKPIPVPLIISNSPICNGQNLNLFGNGGVSFVWQGPMTYSSTQQYSIINQAVSNNSGVYHLTVTAANSCTASVSETLVVNPTPTVSASGSTVCETQTLNLSSNSIAGASYFWVGPNSYTSNVQNPSFVNPSAFASGIYTVKVISSQGCTNVASADVTVTALPLPVIMSNSPRCFNSSLELLGNGGDTYLWTGPNNFTSTQQNPQIAPVNLANAGVYTLQVTMGPCVNSTSHTLEVFPLTSFSVGSNSPVCETKSLSLMAEPVLKAVSYVWHGPLGFVNHNQVAGRDSSKLTYSGIYHLTVVDSNFCENSATLNVSISKNPILSALSKTVCINSDATLQVSGANTYTWAGPDLFTSSEASVRIKNVKSLTPTVYTVIGESINTCTTANTVSITTTPLPNPALTVYPNNTVCLGKQVSLEGFGGIDYEWKGPSNFNFGEKIFTFTLNSMAYSGTYTLMVTDALGCSNFTQTTLSFDPLPSGTLLGSTMDACVPFHSDFKYYSADSSKPIIAHWQINNEAAFDAKTFSKSFPEPGDYLIHGTFLDTLTTCASTATFVVHARENPIADFTSSPYKPVESQDEVLFTNRSKGNQLSKFSWYFINNATKISKQQNTSYLFKEAGVYPIAMVVKNAWGCTDTIVKAITIETDFNVFVPNAFTPNDDYKNQTFLPVCTGVKFYELNVFNRWGKLIFHSSDLNVGWDGSYHDEPCKEDIYVWQIKASSTHGEMKKLTGHVTLYR
jgi:gliding motility-associated-like protein